MAATARRGKILAAKVAEPHSQGNTLTQLQLAELLHQKAVIELIMLEFEPGHYRLEASIMWRVGRWPLVATRGPRVFRSLDTLATFLKTIGAGRTLVRLEGMI